MLKTVKTCAKAFRNAQPRRHKLSQGQIHRFFWAVQELPHKTRSIASSGRSSLPFAKRSQPTGTPRPHQWLLMGVQACRLPAPKRLKRLKPLKRLQPLKLKARFIAFLLGGPACRSPGVRSQQAPQGHINGFLWASKPAVCQPLNA